ncbi:putative B3 domain-containing protein Os03g0621600 isoform X2 [Nymphaea colorata]|uniref:putative B3 domain-containing protein Os03g0621600 isoform X2 n=1 Tax=Nymphaea colorata TaxID=210225 RepID=UPI00214E1E2E|nr:putative B3 domain-containing protein Os03g0621600 isoform X2 [Nymphaea colorata]
MQRCKECGEPVGRFQEKKQRIIDNAIGLRFFKIMIGDFTSNLCIPPAFASRIRVDKCATATLNNRTSIPWPVKVHWENNLLFLGDGWREFAEHHSLQYGDFLVFNHNGDLDFDVQIFDRSGCERVAAHLAKRGKVHKVEEEAKEPHGPSKGPLNDSLVLGGAMGKKPLNPGKALSLSDHPAFMSTYRYASGRREVTKEERLQALEAAHSLKLNRPHFTVTMSESNVYMRFTVMAVLNLYVVGALFRLLIIWKKEMCVFLS